MKYKLKIGIIIIDNLILNKSHFAKISDPNMECDHQPTKNHNLIHIFF